MPAPIILFVYNRPEHARRTLDALSKNALARESELWIFADGAKGASDEDQVAAVRRMVGSYATGLETAANFRKIHLHAWAWNRGLAFSVISGVSSVMRSEGRGIVVEDDLVTAPDFLPFMNAALDYYQDNPAVGSISGYTPPVEIPADYEHSVWVMPRSSSLGWATWSDRWNAVDWDVNDFGRFQADLRARRAFNACGSDRFDRLRRQVKNDAGSWSVRFGYSQFRRGMHTVYPTVSRVLNIGNDASGVHVDPTARYNTRVSNLPVPFVLSTPQPDKRIIRQMKRLYSGPALSRLARTVRNLPVPARLSA
jgi:hypothetical protein